MKILSYHLVAGDDAQDLSCRIVRLINEGYQPFGSPFCAGRTYYQAVVKYADTV